MWRKLVRMWSMKKMVECNAMECSEMKWKKYGNWGMVQRFLRWVIKKIALNYGSVWCMACRSYPTRRYFHSWALFHLKCTFDECFSAVYFLSCMHSLQCNVIMNWLYGCWQCECSKMLTWCSKCRIICCCHGGGCCCCCCCFSSCER